MKDIAKICNVAVSTVSKAMNDRSDISPDKKEEIQRVARELGYVPNYMAATLKSKKTHNIGVLLSEDTGMGLLHEHFTRILNSFKTTVEERGYTITFINISKVADRLSYLEQCKYMNFDGVFILCADFNADETKELLASRLPLVTIDYDCERHVNIASNHYDDMLKLMEFVYMRGHRKIAYIHGEMSPVTELRLKAYNDYLMSKNIEVNREYIYTCPYHDHQKGISLTKAMFNLKEPPTCILYPDDLVAVGGLNMLQIMGKQVPGDISIAGYDGVNIVGVVKPHITTIRQDTTSMGIQAGNKLIDRMEHPEENGKTDVIVVDGMLEHGESVGVV